MKFWKSLSVLIEETLPDWRDNFLSYKDLKKQLKLVCPGAGGKPPNKRPRLEGLDLTDGGDCGCKEETEVDKEVIDFVSLLEEEVEKLNAFFVEKEEEYVIKWKELEDRVAKAEGSNDELMKVGTEIVDFHGEMVLLENYSALNYTGLVKILKKYDKQTGGLIRMPFIQKVLQEPFFTTDVLNKLVKECEAMLDHVFSMNVRTLEETEDNDGSQPTHSAQNKEIVSNVPKELMDIEHMESMYIKLTSSALRVLKEVRSGSSTVSIFSLPPVQSNTSEDLWKKIPVVEQIAK